MSFLILLQCVKRQLQRPNSSRIRLFACALIFHGLTVSLSAQTLQHRYSFSNSAADSAGSANGTLVGNAFITNNALLLPGGGSSASPLGYVSLPSGIVSNDTSITVECWLTDTAGSVWAEAWCFGDSAAGPGQPPSSGTSYISLIPHSGANDLRAAFNNNVSEIDVTGPAQNPLPLNVEEYVIVTYDAPSATATLYLNGIQQGVASVPTNHAPSTYGKTFNNWFGRDEFGGDPMFAGSIDELRIWNAAVSPLYIAVSTFAGPNILVTNLTPSSVKVTVTNTTMGGSQTQPATVSANFSQVTNVTVTSFATNWTSSNTNILTVNSAGLITSVGIGSATISATVNGTTGTSAPISVSPLIGANTTVGYWQFDNSSNLGADSSGLSNTITSASGSPIYSSAGKFGGALYLDGNSTMATLSGGFPFGVPVNASPYSIAVWEKVDAGCPNDGGFLGWGLSATNAGNNLRLNGANSVDDYWFANNFVVSGLTANPMDGNWHSIAVTWDGALETMYVDGANVGTRTPGTLPAIVETNFIVGKTTSDVNFKGWVDNLLIANFALTPAEIGTYQAGNWPASQAPFPQTPTASPSNSVYAGTTVSLNASVVGQPPFQYQWQKNGSNLSGATAATLILSNAAITSSGNYTLVVANGFGTNTSPALPLAINPVNAGVVTVGYWRFNNSTNLGLDSGFLGNNLTTASGTPTYSSAGMFGGSLYLDGNSTMTTASGAFPLSVPTNVSPYSIAVWEKVDTGCPNNGGFIGWGNNSTSRANDFRLNGPFSLDDYWYNNDFIASGLPSDPMDGNWHAVAVTWDGTNQIMYLDGQNVGARSPAALPAVQAANFVIGKTTADVNFQGWLEDLLIANVALAPADLAVYQSGNWSPSLSASPLLPTASPSNAVYAGTTVTLSALVTGAPPFQYQWQKNGTNIPSASGAQLVLTNAMVPDSGNYAVIAANTYATNTSPALTVTVYPPSAPVITQQPSPAATTNYLGGLVTFTAGVAGTQPIYLQWQHNGVNIPNATASSLSLATLQAGNAGNYTLVASNSMGLSNSQPAVLTVLPPPNPSALNVLTYHCDNTRDGANTNEVLLTPANVNVSTFGRLISYVTDGLVIAQPLYVASLVIPGQGTHNVVFVATENNTVYAFDADSTAGTNGGLLWQTNLGIAISSFNGEFGTRYQGTYYGDIVPIVGITGTPVIDRVSGTLYVNVHTREVGATTNYFHRIHALNITNGTEQPYSPVVVNASVPGIGVGSSNGVVNFSAIQENQRPGMTLAGGMVYAAYGSYADTDPYHGWVIGFNATNLAQSSNYVFNTTPNATVAVFGVNAGEGALWMGGNGLCADVSNNLFFATGNGSFSANTNGGDFGDSFVKLSTSNRLAVADYFTPYNQFNMAVNDTDLGSGGTILLPDSVGSAAHPHLIVGAGKAGILHLVDRDNMGRFNSTNDSQIVQEVPNAITGAWSTPAYFNNHIYYQGSGDVMKAFLITNAVIVATPTSEARTSFSALGGTPFISANGTNNGIVWTIQSDANPAVLHAYDATNLATELYNSSQNVNRDSPGGAIKMTAPIAVNGKVFVGTQYGLSIFGNSLFLTTPVISPTGGMFTNSITVTLSDATPNSTIYYTLDGTRPTTNSLIYTGSFVLTTSATVQAIAAQPGAANSGVASAGFVDSSAIGTGTGLQGSYWSNVTSVAFTNPAFSLPPTLVRTDATVNFNWTTTPPASSIGLTNFCVRWLGSIQPEYSEAYTFATITDSGVRLYVNGHLLIDKWINQPATAWSNTISLVAQQRYNIEMDFYNPTGGAQAQLNWSSPSTPYALIPQTQLYPVTNPPPAVALSGPTNGSSFTASASVSIIADADAQYNLLSYVSFYTNGALVGIVSNAPYAFTLTGLSAGNYTLTAMATDASGLTGTSAPIAITVNAGSGLPYGLTTNAALGAFLNQNMPGSFTGTIPALLSATGAFADTANRVPGAGLISYVPNTPLWSDNAVKSRYLGLPSNGGGLISPAQQIAFAPTGQWTFPSGTVFVKNFDLVVDATNPNIPVRRLETRLLVRDTNGAVYGVTYKWRPDNSDADVLTGSLTEAINVTNASGVTTQNWYYPSPSDCLSCHTPVAGYVLGVNSRQLNGSNTYPATGVSDNQLRTLNRLGLFNPAFNEAAIAGYEKLSSVTNLSAPLVERARSYLDANCAQCHQPGGNGITFDARYDTPLTNQNLINTLAAFSLGYDNARVVAPSDVWRSVLYDRMNTVDPTIKMSTLARNMIDTNAVAVIAAWINSLGGTPALPPPTLNPAAGIYTGFVSVTAGEAATNDTLYYTLDGSLPTTNSILYTGPILLTNSAFLSINTWAPGYTNSVATLAQYNVLPGPFFVSSGGFTNGTFQMSFAGTPGSNYVLQVSTNLTNWVSISTNTPSTSPFVMSDPGAPGRTHFYRVLQEP